VNAGPVGSYQVNQGPAWGGNPPCYTCREACALLFGGVATDYQCSTSNALIDNKGYLDGWGDSQYCNNAQPQDFKKNTFYNCGNTSCSFSAYVSDHGCSSRNYCWK
jgi:hypothetical protein